jgi:phosphoribosylformylglycinamidine synthase subunit PurSL
MAHRIEVMTRGDIDNSLTGLVSKRPIRVFNIDDKLSGPELDLVMGVLTDPVVDQSRADKPILGNIDVNRVVVEVSPKAGVNDPVGQETRKVLSRLLGREIGGVSTASQYVWTGDLSEDKFTGLKKRLGNPVINDFRKVDGLDWSVDVGMGFHYPKVDLPSIDAFQYVDISGPDISDADLIRISEDRYLALNLEEMKTIRDLFKDPDFIRERKARGLSELSTDSELECLAQTWSEHCVHKKLGAKWEYTSDDPEDESGLSEVTDNVFKTIIQGATRTIQEQGIDWIVSVFEDNAGVIKLNDRYNVAHKVETHNHPSSIEAHGGANTGTGGVIRDPTGTGKFMDIVSSQFAFRFPHILAYASLPDDIQSPMRTLEGLVSGVEDYGNKMGIPTMCGNVFVDEGWLKCAVYVGAVAVAEAEKNGRLSHTKEIFPGYIALSLGGKVGKDGIHGATGSSTDLKSGAEQKDQVNQSVQIGSPLTQKGVFEVMNILDDLDYIEGSQDCGAGGWNSAVGELGALLNELEQGRFEIQHYFGEYDLTRESSLADKFEAASGVMDFNMVGSPLVDTLRKEIETGIIFDRESNGMGGVRMDLSNVPEKYKGLTGWEKLVSEAQERMIVVIKPERLEEVLEICGHNNVEATKLAEFNDTGRYEVLDQGETISYLPMEFLHTGLPQMEIKAHWTPSKNKEPDIDIKGTVTKSLIDILGRPNLQSYEWIRTRFDHEVQGGSLIKPIVGEGRVDSDAIAYRPVLGEEEVVIESLGSNPWQGDIDAYHMGRNNVVDAIGRIIAAGGNLEKICFNGNTTCPKPETDPKVAADVLRMLKGSADAEVAFGTPRISGKDSTSMQRTYKSIINGKDIVVKAKSELLMSGLGVIDNDSTLTTCDFKFKGDSIYVVGETRDELGASEFYNMHGEVGRNVPKSNFDEIKSRFEAMGRAIGKGLVHSAQYIGKGGLGYALAKCSIGGDLGADIQLGQESDLGRFEKLLYSESTGRFVVSVPTDKREDFEREFDGIYFERVGMVREEKNLCICYGREDSVRADIRDLKKANQGEIKV